MINLIESMIENVVHGQNVQLVFEEDKSKTHVLWAMHPDTNKVLLQKPNSEISTHASWFHKAGLPSHGPKFDNIHRGEMLINHQAKDIATYTHPRIKKDSSGVYRSHFLDTPDRVFDKIGEVHKTNGYSITRLNGPDDYEAPRDSIGRVSNNSPRVSVKRVYNGD